MPVVRPWSGPVSAAIYIAIVAIWACVLIPRWVRRPHLLGGEATETDSGETEETSADQDAPAGRRFGPLRHNRRAAAATQDYESEPVRQERPVVPQARSHVLQARRRLLTMLVTLAVMAGTCTYFKLTHWWVCIPPAAMLGMYLLLLREAARADADRARAWQEVPADYAWEPEPQPVPEPTAEVIDLSARLEDQLYDQYADATMRAVGD
jgi:hypothetical protein